MPLTHLLVLSAVQGISEFLPISSSGHLILVPWLTGWQDQGLMLDVAVHLGTLLAVMVYFSKDIFGMIFSLFNSLLKNSANGGKDPELQLFCKLSLATLPVVIAGLVLNYHFVDIFRSVEVIGWTTLIFGALLFFSDRISMTVRSLDHITFRGALVIGLFQVLALIPGTSRSGITITAARFQGVERQDAAKFSLLLSIPVIAAAGILKSYDLFLVGESSLIQDVAIVASFSFGFAIVTIALFMTWLKHAGFTPFVFYRILLGGVLLCITYWFPELNL
ncbi:MAG: undecaprenyl-diphosphate phosphatase [Pseudomonadota bacterium]|nr:undecaprenyl-diphosphate phosphatase [Pseudomonadota bacterium]